MNQQCKQCSKTFQITSADLEFYKKILVPPPTLCPDCRQQRRLAWCNEMNLYTGQCGSCHKNILTIYSPQSPHTYYCRECWWSDHWNPLDYGQPIDWQKPFFQQLDELNKRVPHQATDVGGNNENSDYTHYAGDNKNCYLIFHADFSENCMYGYGIKECKDTIDGYNNFNCELCYDCVDCHNCYNLKWSQDCVSCYDSFMLKDCVGCRDCFGSISLRNQQYCWFNEQLTQAEYTKRLQQINFGSASQVDQWLKKVRTFQETKFYKYGQGNKNEDCTGNNIYQSKNVLASYDCREVENSKFSYQLSMGVKDSYDCYQYGLKSELIYECSIVGGNCYDIKFCHQVFDGCSAMEYCISSTASKNCFGSVALRHQEFCILNKQYSADEYKKLKLKIIAQMTQSGDYGQHFPATMSPFGYNETPAQIIEPLQSASAEQLGVRWQEQLPGVSGKQTITEIPNNIAETTDTILKEILGCQHCGRNYKIQTAELNFYRKLAVPLPRLCVECRYLERLQRINPQQLWHRQCMCTQVDHHHKGLCATEFDTTYSPDSKEIVYCEQCYQKEVY